MPNERLIDVPESKYVFYACKNGSYGFTMVRDLHTKFMRDDFDKSDTDGGKVQSIHGLTIYPGVYPVVNVGVLPSYRDTFAELYRMYNADDVDNMDEFVSVHEKVLEPIAKFIYEETLKSGIFFGYYGSTESYDLDGFEFIAEYPLSQEEAKMEADSGRLVEGRLTFDDNNQFVTIQRIELKNPRKNRTEEVYAVFYDGIYGTEFVTTFPQLSDGTRRVVDEDSDND